MARLRAPRAKGIRGCTLEAREQAQLAAWAKEEGMIDIEEVASLAFPSQRRQSQMKKEVHVRRLEVRTILLKNGRHGWKSIQNQIWMISKRKKTHWP